MPTEQNMEHKQVGFGLKAIGSEGDMTLSGYGAFFNNVDSYGDKIAPGAFDDTIKSFKSSGQWPAMLQQHGGWGLTSDDMMPIGVWTDIEEDEKGLVMNGKLADTQRGRDAYSLLKMQPRPALNGLSIGYTVGGMEVHPDAKNGEARRTLKQINLWETSLVTFPANDKARISSVKTFGQIKTIRDFEKYLRDAGFPNEAARDIALNGFKARTEPRDEAGGLDDLAIAIKRNIAALSTPK